MIVGRLEVKMRLRCGTKFGMNKCDSVTLKMLMIVVDGGGRSRHRRTLREKLKRPVLLKGYTASFATSNDVLCFYIKNIKPS